MIILLVEDNDLFRQEIKGLLSSRFSSVTIVEAAQGSEAVVKFQEEKPDLVFMDIALPGENGLAVTRKIKQARPNAVVAILTNYDYPEYRKAAEDSGADYFLVKGDASLSALTMIVQPFLNQPARDL